VGRGTIFFSLLDITSRDKTKLGHGKKTHLNWRNKKIQKPKKKKPPIKLRVGLKTYMSIGWWTTQQQKKELQLLSHLRENCTWRPPTDPKGHIKEASIFKP
jgi:hypothetical protein